MARILLACEESQAVTKEFRKLGHEAFSCDIQECSGGHPDWHYEDDIFHVLSKSNNLKWDFIGAHPTCTYLTNSGVCWLYNKDGSKNIERWVQLEKAVTFFNVLKSNIEAVGCGYLENPIPHKYARDGFKSVVSGELVEGIGKYDQIIQPYQFGHPESKATCLWIIGLPKLKETDNVKDVWKALPKKEAQRLHYLPPGPERAKLRSKTFPGIAEAMAKQWSSDL